MPRSVFSAAAHLAWALVLALGSPSLPAGLPDDHDGVIVDRPVVVAPPPTSEEGEGTAAVRGSSERGR